MHVIATAGHVDHGKSTLVRALTGVDPDRLEEERRRGLTIELGYCWTSLPGVGDVAFVDVPGHERFVPTMLSGIGPVPAVLFVVAADDPWMPQAAEHLAALDALGVSRGVLAVTRSDLVDPAPALERSRAELARTALRDIPAVMVSGRTGAGLDELRDCLAKVVGTLPEPDPDADVRLWVDRCFHVRGAGTVVTGTLPAGSISVGDTLALAGSGQQIRIRGVQSLGHPVRVAHGVARVALNVSGADVEELDRNSVLVTPRAWWVTDVVDVRVVGEPVDLSSGSRPQLHIGATSVSVHLRPLDTRLARLTLERPLPLRIGDRALLRDPGSRTLWGIKVLDPAPPNLQRRGAARQRATALAGADGKAILEQEVARRGIVRLSHLRRIGVQMQSADSSRTARPGDDDVLLSGDWALSAAHAAAARDHLHRLVEEHSRKAPLERGVPVGAIAHALGLPEPELVSALVRAPLRLEEGRVVGQLAAVLPASLERALASLAHDLDEAPFGAPTADRLRELGLDPRSVSAAAKAGRLLRVAEGIVLMPGADRLAASWLAELPQPFTTSEARVRLATSRRVALPLLAHLDRLGHTRRFEDDRRSVRQ